MARWSADEKVQATKNITNNSLETNFQRDIDLKYNYHFLPPKCMFTYQYFSFSDIAEEEDGDKHSVMMVVMEPLAAKGHD